MASKKALYIVPNLRVGTGVTSVIINHYDKLILEGYSVDFCMLQNRESPFFEKIKENGGKVYSMPSGENGYPNKKETPEFLEQLIKNGDYEVVHTHIVGRFAVYTAYYAKKYKVPFRIYHAHNPRDVHDLKSFVASFLYDNLCVMLNNKYLACSKDAGKSVFKNKSFEVIKNTIDTKKLAFSEKNRSECRKRLNIQNDTFVMGTVCRISYQKNPFFLIDIFEQVHKMNSNSILIWAGDGELDNELKKYIASKNLSKEVILLGASDNVASLYAAMDVFVLPSRYEGLGIVYIEAQAAGLRTFASDVVPRDTNVTDLISYLPLQVPSENWAKQILSVMPCSENREKYSFKVDTAGFDTASNNDLVDYYKKMV